MRDDLLSEMKSSTNTYVVALKEFYSHFTVSDTFVYAFFEGKTDKHYYNPRIRNIVGELNYKSFICGGKKNVIKISNIIANKSTYDKCRIGYFVDADFDKPVKRRNLYTTKYHSVENFYVTLESVERILEEYFDIVNLKDRQACMRIYREAFCTFYDRLTHLNCWLACHSDLSEVGINAKLNINDITSDIFKTIFIKGFKVDYFTEVSSYDLIERLFGNRDVSLHVFQSKLELFQKEFNLNYIRGKFSLIFIFAFVKQMKIELGNKNLVSCSKIYYLNSIGSPELLLMHLSNYAETPNSLSSFIHNTFKKNQNLIYWIFMIQIPRWFRRNFVFCRIR